MKTKQNTQRLYRSQKIALIVAILLVAVLLVMNTFSWFVDNASKSDFDFSIGDVNYQLTALRDDVFYNLTELSIDVGEEEKEYDGIPVNAASFDVVVTLDSGTNADYSVAKYSTSKIGIVFYDEDGIDITSTCTDVVIFASSSPNHVSVSSFGTMYGKGNIGTTSEISLELYHRDAEGNIGAPYSDDNSFTVEVIESTEQVYGYLPAGAHIMRTPLQIRNNSTVPTKLRTKVTWQYTGYDEETTNERITTHISSLNLSTNVNFTCTEDSAPIEFSIPTENDTPLWHDAPVFSDENVLYFSLGGYDWVVEELSFRDVAEQTTVLNWISNPEGNCPIESVMIDKAYTYLCYSTDVITTSQAQNNYGTTIPAASSAQGDVYTILNQITISNSYTAYSTKKFLSIYFDTEARQSDFFANSKWFDVACYTQSGE